MTENKGFRNHIHKLYDELQKKKNTLLDAISKVSPGAPEENQTMRPLDHLLLDAIALRNRASVRTH
jgi:DNA-binding transcriptional MocR family regulator